jgi:thioesterase domain-containing protein/acyl carrier protein
MNSINQVDDVLTKIRQSIPELRAEDAFVVSRWFYQQQSWLSDPLKSDNAIYNYALAIRIRGPLNDRVVRQSLQQLLQRHAALRSVFRVMDGELAQIITPATPIRVPIIDLSGSPTASAHDLEARARHVAVQQTQRPFDLSQGPLLRASLLRFDREDHVLLLITHHIVYDDWSTGILIRELTELYSASLAGRPSVLPLLSFSYGDFVRWLQRKMQNGELGSRLDFWKRELAGGNDFHHLQTDRPRSERRTYRGKCASVIIPEDLTHSLRMLGQQERGTLFMILLAAFQCLLHYCSGEEDIAVGSCAANRPLSQVEGLIGRFGNDLVLRTDLTGNPTFRELFARVRKTTLTAFSYQDIPFGQLVDELQSSQPSGRNPLFQTMFILQDAPKPNGEIPGLSLSFFPLELETAKYDLNVWLKPQQGLQVVFEYNSDLFEAATMERMLDRYQRLLDAIAKNPDMRTNELSLPSLVKEVGSRVRDSRADLPPPDDIEAELVEIWEKMLGRRHILVTDDYFEQGGTSLLAVRLFAQIEKAFGIELPLSTLLRATTIKELSEVIRANRTGPSRSCLVEIQRGGKRPPFFCIHGAGGSVLRYRDLARYLGPDQPFYGLQPQGIDGKRPFLTRIEDMAALYLDEIRNFKPEGPYFLGGYCGGGTIAFEMAQQLQAQGQTVALLALFDTYNWAKIKPESRLDRIHFHLQSIVFRCGNFLLLGSRDKLKCLQRKVMDLKRGIVDRVAKDHWKSNSQSSTLGQLTRVNDGAALCYLPKIYPGRISHFRPLKLYGRYDRPEMSWDKVTRGGVATFVIPVYPGALLDEPFVRDVAAKLRTCLEAPTESSQPSRLLKNYS